MNSGPNSRLPDFVLENASRFPNREALVLGDVRYTWAETASLVETYARALFVLGIRRGDRVAMLSTPRPEYVIVLMAALRIGAVWVGLNPRYQPREIEYVLRDACPRAVFTLVGFEGRDYSAEINSIRASLPGLLLLSLSDSTGLTDFGLQELRAQSFVVDENAYQAAVDLVLPSDPAVIVYTSGTTGAPKGAILSHGGLVLSYTVQAVNWPIDPLRLINNMPINHIGGVGDLTAYSTVSGGTMVFMERFEPAKMLHLIKQEQITALGQVTAMYQKITACQEWATADLSSLQFLWWAGSDAPLDLVNELSARCPKTATYYGMTELTGSVTYVDALASNEAKARSIGRPDPSFSVRIAHDDGTQAHRGEPGEIQVKGGNVFLGYWGQPEATTAAFTGDGWFKTGDVASIRPDGNWEIVGRMKEMYKSGGYNVYPREIELVLEVCPGIESACVIAVPDPEWQEVGCAYVKAVDGYHLDQRAVYDYLRTALANYKLPKAIFLISEWPTTVSGKIDKQRLRQLAVVSRLEKPR